MLRLLPERTAPPFAQQTSDGTLVCGVVEARPRTNLARLADRVASAGRLASDGYRVDFSRRRVELGAAALRRFARGLREPAFVVEEYPTADALEVEREPLNRAAFPGFGGT